MCVRLLRNVFMQLRTVAILELLLFVSSAVDGTLRISWCNGLLPEGGGRNDSPSSISDNRDTLWAIFGLILMEVGGRNDSSLSLLDDCAILGSIVDAAFTGVGGRKESCSSMVDETAILAGDLIDILTGVGGRRDSSSSIVDEIAIRGAIVPMKGCLVFRFCLAARPWMLIAAKLVRISAS